jgi:hypothetical protein
MTDRQYEKYQSSLSTADAVYAATGDLGQKSDIEVLSAVEQLRPKAQGEFADPDTARKMEVYNMAKTMARNALAARKADPASEVMRNFTPVQYAMQGLMRNPEDPGHARNFVKKSLAAQASIGMPVSDQKPLPKEMAAKIAGDIANPNAQVANLALKKYEQQFGPYWEQVFRQVSPKMDPATYVASTMEDDNARTVLIDASRRPKADLLKLAGVKESQLSDSVVAHSSFRDFMGAMGPYGVNNSNISSVRQAVETLALGYMVSMAQDPDTAVDNAMTQVMSKYSFGSINSQPFMMPKEVDASGVESGARALLRTVDVSQFDLPAGLPGQTEADIRRGFERSIRTNGRWVTAPGMKGLQLYADRFRVTRFGRPVTYTWDQLMPYAQGLFDESTREVLQDRVPGAN